MQVRYKGREAKMANSNSMVLKMFPISRITVNMDEENDSICEYNIDEDKIAPKQNKKCCSKAV